LIKERKTKEGRFEETATKRNPIRESVS